MRRRTDMGRRTDMRRRTGIRRRPSILLIVADQLRGRDLACTGNSAVDTPNLDELAARGVVADQYYANAPVCCPSRATMFSGLYPLRHRVVGNDLPVPDDVPFLAEPLRAAGYRTGYIGKWHLDGMPRSRFTPPGPRRHGFDFWAVYNCSHDYFSPRYYRDSDQLIVADGYEPVVQTDLAAEFLHGLSDDDAFLLTLSFGPPHDPYDQVPEEFRARYPTGSVPLPPNVDDESGGWSRIHADYLAAVTALDVQVGRLVDMLVTTGRLEDTIVVFTSDHGDMLGAHGWRLKQLPHEEAVHVPLVVSWPGGLPAGDRRSGLLSTVDLAPTLLGLAGVDTTTGVDGRDRSELLRSGAPGAAEVYLQNVTAFDEAVRSGKPEWRGVRTERWTYAETAGRRPWLLLDNANDPWQRVNLVEDEDHAAVRADLAARLGRRLDATGDPFLGTDEMIRHLGLDEEWERRQSGLTGAGAPQPA